MECTVNPGETFLDRMISMVEGATRKTPNEITLTILLTALTIIFVLVCATLYLTSFAADYAGAGDAVSILVLIALLVLFNPNHHWWLAFVYRL